MLGNSIRQLNEAIKPTIGPNGVGPSNMAPILMLQAQVLAGVAQAYMTGGLICIQLADNENTTEPIPFDLRRLIDGASTGSQESSSDEGMDQSPA